jgi:hypothetical protein
VVAASAAGAGEPAVAQQAATGAAGPGPRAGSLAGRAAEQAEREPALAAAPLTEPERLAPPEPEPGGPEPREPELRGPELPAPVHLRVDSTAWAPLPLWPPLAQVQARMPARLGR